MSLKAEELSMVVTKSTPLRNSFKHGLLYILGQVLYPVWLSVHNKDHWPHCTSCINNIYIYIHVYWYMETIKDVGCIYTLSQGFIKRK